MPSFLETGFDILNPVQRSAAGMDPEILKPKYGRDLVFWGGGVDTQQMQPFGTPREVRGHVLRRCEAFHREGSFVINAVHTQAGTLVKNIVTMADAVHQFGSGQGA
jgi:hypothetical protein